MKTSLFTALFVGVAANLSAQTPVYSVSDPIPGWGPINRFGGTESVRGNQVIDNTYDRGTVAGSLRFFGAAGTPSGLRNRAALLNLNPGGFGLLSDLQSVGFDWFRSSTSTTGGIQAPALRLFVRSGTTGTTLSELIWEYAYNGPGNAPIDAWQSVSNSLTTGTWWRFSGGEQQPCTGVPDSPLYTSLGNWNTCLGTGAFVYGISVGLGSIPDVGSFDGAVDLPTMQFGTQNAQTFDFGTVPEPSTYALLATGLIGVFAAKRRRRTTV